MSRSNHIRRLLGVMMLVGVALTACQDTSPTPSTWTVGELHDSVGLTGGHQHLECADCHEGSTLKPVSSPCEDCHLELRDTVTDPNHLERAFSTRCVECHTSEAWRPAFFDHDSLGFALRGAHARLICADCHPVGQTYSGLPTDCYSCHTPDYEGARPDHLSLEFGQQCQDCHTVFDWRSDVFDHEQTQFALRGAHVGLACVTCHAEGYSETSTDCIGCHATDEPRDHFGPDCSVCHTDSAWTPSTFDHEPSFPLQRGNHRDYRDDCVACHSDFSDYEVFTCTDCHDGEHERRETDDDHDDVPDYRYESEACYDCHPRGEEDDAEEGDDD